MTIAREQVKALIDELADEDVELIGQVAERLASWKHTRELLANKDMLADIQATLQDVRAGRTVSWHELESKAINNGHL